MAEMVVDPGVPPEDAELLRESERVLLRVRRGWVPESRRPPRMSRIGRVTLTVLGVIAVCVVASAGGIVTEAGGALVLMLIGIPLLLAAFIRADVDDLGPSGEEAEVDKVVYEQARWYDGRYVLPADLDESSRRLLERAQVAIAAVTESTVNAEGLLDDVRNAVMLPAQEWEIARLLAKLSALRTKHRETVSEGITPEVAAVAEPLARALDGSEDAVVARVESLERYARNVAEAERAYRAHHQIEELRGRLHQYEELVAETGADAFAVPEIAQLTREADQLEQALRRSVSSAHEAFRYLAP